MCSLRRNALCRISGVKSVPQINVSSVNTNPVTTFTNKHPSQNFYRFFYIYTPLILVTEIIHTYTLDKKETTRDLTLIGCYVSIVRKNVSVILKHILTMDLFIHNLTDSAVRKLSTGSRFKGVLLSFHTCYSAQ